MHLMLLITSTMFNYCCIISIPVLKTSTVALCDKLKIKFSHLMLLLMTSITSTISLTITCTVCNTLPT